MKKFIARPFVKLEISKIDCKCCVENKCESATCSDNEVLKVENKYLKSNKISCCCRRLSPPSPDERKLNDDKKPCSGKRT